MFRKTQVPFFQFPDKTLPKKRYSNSDPSININSNSYIYLKYVVDAAISAIPRVA